MMLIAASCPSNSEAAVTKRNLCFVWKAASGEAGAVAESDMVFVLTRGAEALLDALSVVLKVSFKRVELCEAHAGSLELLAEHAIQSREHARSLALVEGAVERADLFEGQAQPLQPGDEVQPLECIGGVDPATPRPTASRAQQP